MYIGSMSRAVLKIFISSICFAAIQAGAQTPASIDLQDINGGHHKLEDYKGKVVLLNFWATYCVPCAAEMPLLGEMQKRYKDKLVILAASIDDPVDRPKLKPFLVKHKAGNLTLMVGPTLDTLSDLHLGSLPDTMFFDSDGKLVAKSVGALKRPELEHRLSEMIGPPVIKAPQSEPKKSSKPATAH